MRENVKMSWLSVFLSLLFFLLTKITVFWAIETGRELFYYYVQLQYTTINQNYRYVCYTVISICSQISVIICAWLSEWIILTCLSYLFLIVFSTFLLYVHSIFVCPLCRNTTFGNLKNPKISSNFDWFEITDFNC